MARRVIHYGGADVVLTVEELRDLDGVVMHGCLRCLAEAADLSFKYVRRFHQDEPLVTAVFSPEQALDRLETAIRNGALVRRSSRRPLRITPPGSGPTEP